MHVIQVRNVNEALPEACHQLRVSGVERESRNGPVRMFPFPVTTLYRQPRERVMFWPERDANPFFHFFESLWMLAGRDDVEFVQQFNSGMANFSDDGQRFNAAYGHRWRRHFGKDQLGAIANALQASPTCRRQVLAVWDGHRDLGLDSKDLPCNTQAYFQRDEFGRLEMMVTNRSNDMVWGAYGANAVHYSVLQEYLAGIIGCEVGRYWQVSMNTHLYLQPHGELLGTMADKAPQPPSTHRDYYVDGLVQPFPLMSIPARRWDRELSEFMVNPGASFADPFFEHVAKPLFLAWLEFKTRDFVGAARTLSNCAARDWHLACREWVARREAAWKLKSA